MFQLVSDLTVYQKYKIVASYEFRGLYVGSVELDTVVYLQFVNLYTVTMNDFCDHSYFYPDNFMSF